MKIIIPKKVMAIYITSSTFKIIMLAHLITLTGVSLPESSVADDESRVGAIQQLPFGGGSRNFVDFSGTRLGLTVQYAKVEEDEKTVIRQIERRYLDGHLKSTRVTSETSQIDEGNQAYGAEVSAFLQPFSGWTPSVECHGFYGNNEIQGALGAGYDWEDGLYGTVKAMFPYSEVGLRFFAPIELYAGGKTLGAFDPDSKMNVYEVVTERREKSKPVIKRTSDSVEPETEEVVSTYEEDPADDGFVLETTILPGVVPIDGGFVVTAPDFDFPDYPLPDTGFGLTINATPLPTDE